MYHIKSDKRSQASAAEIVRGLEECLKTAPLKAITVSDIHRATGVSRATFYRLFDTPEDVLHYRFSQMTASMAENYTANWQEDPNKLLEITMAVGMENHEFLRALVDSGRFDILYQYTEQNFRLLDAHKTILPQEMSAVEREYLLGHLSMTMVSTLITWSRNGRQETALEVVEYLKKYMQVLLELTGSGIAAAPEPSPGGEGAPGRGG